MATTDRDIGRCRCPVCKSPRAHLRIAKSQLAYVVCNACNMQLMTRSERSDEGVRAWHIPDSDSSAAPAPAPSPPPAPAGSSSRATPAPAPAPAANGQIVNTIKPAPAPAAVWGAFPWIK